MSQRSQFGLKNYCNKKLTFLLTLVKPFYTLVYKLLDISHVITKLSKWKKLEAFNYRVLSLRKKLYM